MRIDLGNFGNAQRQAVSTQVNRGDVTAMADAKINAGRQQEQTAAQIGQAWGQVGQNLTRLGENMEQRIGELAQQKAALVIQQKELYGQGVLQDLQDRVNQGELKSDDVQKAYADSMASFKYDDISGLHGANQERFSAGLANVDMKQQGDVHQLYRNAHRVETRATVEEMVANTGRLALKNGNLEQAEKLYDSPVFQASVREAFGASAGAKLQEFKSDLYKNDIRNRIQTNTNSITGLNDIDKMLNDENGPYANRLSAEDRLSLSNTVNNRRTSLEAKAIAAQNHADSVALRRETAAVHLDNKMSQRIMSGEQPTPEEWDQFHQATTGTSVAGSAQNLQAVMVNTQKLISMPPAQAQEELNAIKLNLDKNGGTAAQYDNYNTLQKTLDTRRAQVQKNPQEVGAMDSGQPLEPVSIGDSMANPGQYGQGLTVRLVNSNAVAQKYGADAGKNLLTADELKDHKAAYAKMTPDQRVQFWRNTSASASPEIATRLAKEIGGDAVSVQSVAQLANTPQGYTTALAVEKGTAMINPPDGLPKVKFDTGTDDSVLSKIKNEYPGISDMRARELVPVVKAYHVGSGADANSPIREEAIHSVIGTPVKASGTTVIVPPGADENVYRDRINTGVNNLGDMADSVRNHLDAGTYAFMTDASGNQVLYNAATKRRVIGPDGRPVVIEVN